MQQQCAVRTGFLGTEAVYASVTTFDVPKSVTKTKILVPKAVVIASIYCICKLCLCALKRKWCEVQGALLQLATRLWCR